MEPHQKAGDRGRPSLAAKALRAIARALRGNRSRAFETDAHDFAAANVALDPLSATDALLELCQRLGKPSSAAQLCGALPLDNGEITFKFVPFALARVGLTAQLGRLSPARLRTVDLPAIGWARSGGAFVITALPHPGIIRLIGRHGEIEVDAASLGDMLTGEFHLIGHADPENGINEDQDGKLLRSNPRLWLLGVFLGERRGLANLIGAALLLNLCALAIPLYMRAVYDRVLPNLAMESLWALSIGVVIVLALELVLRQVRSAFVDSIGGRVGQAIQHRALRAVLAARAQSSTSVGSMMTSLRDIEQIALLVPQALVTFVVDLPSVLAFFALIGLIGGWTILGPVLGAAGLMVVGFIANHAIRLAGSRSHKLTQARGNLIVDVIEGWSTIKANQAEGLFQRRWDIVADHFGVSTGTQRKWSEIPGALSAFMIQLVTVLVVIIGIFQISAGVMTSGAMIAVIMLTGRAMVPVSTAIATVGKLYQCLPQFNGLAAILGSETERQASDPAIGQREISGLIAARGLTHRFDASSEPALSDLAFSIKPGEKVALIGRSGSGKSTVLKLLAGMIEPPAGSLTIDGHAISHYAAAQLRRSIVLSAQDAALFDGTIWDNILLGLPEPEPDLAERAIRCACLNAFVARTVEGYMRQVGPRGSALSGGQKQSLLLARALIRDPQVLLLDEPTASLDITSEQNVIAGLREATRDKTLIVATHRFAVLDLVDRVIWLEDGRIVADRPKPEVLAMLARQTPQTARAA
jgi:ATP-binding cassette, subfamily C, bacterial LapB